ncbi:putative ribonuclease H-like domain-containing protein [Tanacetum coccineum]
MRPVWNNVIRTNHQNFSNPRRNFAPIAVLTKFGIVPISTARHSFSRAATPVSAVRPINTTTPKSFVNVAKPRTNAFQKSHSPSRRHFYQQTALKNKNLNNKVNTIKINSVNTAKEKRVTSAVRKQGINAVKQTQVSNGLGAQEKLILLCLICKIIKIMMEDLLHLLAVLKSVSLMCDKKNSVLFTETECLILSPNFKLPGENQVILKIDRKDNMYSFDLKNIVPSKGLTCLIAKATNDESKLWHRRLGHINFKTLNKLVKGNLVRGFPSKILKMTTHMLLVRKESNIKPLVFFLAKNDKTSGILKNFITGIENQLNHKVKIIRCDNGTEFKNYEMNQFYGIKGIKREFSNARTPQQNRVAKRKNRTLIEAARTMLADSLLPISFWAKAVNTACYVQNKVLVTKPHNKTPYELLIGRTPIISFIRPFGCLVTILNTLDYLGKFDRKADEGVLVGYSINSKDFRVYNHRTRKVEENLHVNFLENKPNVAGNGLEWLFDINSLTNTMNYQLVTAGNRTNGNAAVSSPNDDAADKKTEQESAKEEADALNKMMNQEKESTKHSDNVKNQFEAECNETFYPTGPSSEPPLVSFDGSLPINVHDYPDTPLMPNLEDTAEPQDTDIFGRAYDDDDFYNSPFGDQDVDADADFNSMEPSIVISPIPITRIHSFHLKAQIIRDSKSAVQTRKMAKQNEAGLISFINKQRRTNHKDIQNCLFACFLSQDKPKKISLALDDKSWVEAMQEELLQFKLLNVWTLVDLPHGKKAIGTKWVYRNKKDQRGVMIKNKARLVAQGHRQEEGIDYNEIFAPVPSIEAIRLFLVYASYMDFTVYQMDVKSTFLYGTIEQEVYVSQPPGFVDPEFPNEVYKVEKALDGLHQAPRAWYETLSNYLLENGFIRGIIDKTLFIKKIKNDILLVEQRKDGIFLSQDKYVYDILKKFGFSSGKTASTPMETHKSLAINASEPDVDVHLYSQPKASHMHEVKRIFRYIKGQPTLSLWYPKDSPLDLIAYSDSDYAGSSIDR